MGRQYDRDRSLTGSASRMCKACGKTLVKRERERPSDFRDRVACNRVCQVALLRACVREMDSHPVLIPCRGGCGKELLRSPRLRGHVLCRDCENLGHKTRSSAYRAKLREEAKRYRILMTALGFEDFGELLAYLRTVPWVELDGRRVRGLREAA